MTAESKWELVVSTGDPQGVGPEVSLQASRELLRRRPTVRVVLVGAPAVLRRVGAVDEELRAPGEGPGLCAIGTPLDEAKLEAPPSRAGGTASLEALSQALRRVGNDPCRALVTAPLSKHAVAETLPGFTGHTEWLAAETGTDHPVMLFAAGRLRVALATVHVPLRDVALHLTPSRLRQSLQVLDRGLRDQFRLSRPKIAVLGLNPHAGEGGLLGDEEALVIRPAIQKFVAKGGHAEGPFSADSFFRDEMLAKFDAVLAMYHDQGLLPVKAASFGEAVNVTLGLPLIRTSVDHGCAYDLAGRGEARSSSMLAALELALSLLQLRETPAI